jgi:hypothetical protein
MLDAVLSARKRREVAVSKVVFRDKLPSQVSEKDSQPSFSSSDLSNIVSVHKQKMNVHKIPFPFPLERGIHATGPTARTKVEGEG